MRISKLRDDERGMALIMVMGTSLVLFILATVIVTRALNDQRQVRRQRLHEQAIHVADAGLERGLYQLEQDATYFKGPDAPGSFANVGAEKAWALATAAGATSECPVAGPPKDTTVCWLNGTEGQMVLLKPSNLARLYAVSYVPTKANAVRTRVIRGTFDTGNTTLNFGVLTGGNLTMSSGTTIGGAGNVHSNGNITTSGGSVAGSATSSGSYTNGGTTVGAGSGGGRPPVTIPNIRPRDNYSKSEYDLCPDGTVRKGPAYTAGGASTSSTPCQGTTLATATTTAYRGWRRTTASDPSKGAIWTATQSYDGTYYIYQGSASIIGRIFKVRRTVIAEATPATGTEPLCPRVGGDIEILSPSTPDSKFISPAATGTPFLFLAGRDILLNSWWHLGSNEGVMYATEQFSITGNNAGTGGFKLSGSVVAGDFCHTTGSPVGPGNTLVNAQITYNGWAIPPGIPRLVNWAEL